MKKFISYPRTGTHWLVNLIELYTDKNRYDIMDYTHDDKLISKHEDVDVYLFREPVYVIYSYHKANKTLDIKTIIEEYKNHLNWYLPNSKIILTYEDISKKNYVNIEKVFSIFGDWDKNKFDEIYEKVDKKYTINYVKGNLSFYNEHLLSDNYKKEKEEFILKYSESINKEFSFLNKF